MTASLIRRLPLDSAPPPTFEGLGLVVVILVLVAVGALLALVRAWLARRR